jgi:DNA-binding response OmpR family regulator
MSDKILLVDDEKDILELLRDVFQREGFDSIQTAQTGEDAVAMCRRFQPDVVVLDVMMPGMDGIEACRQIRTFSHCPILFLSAKNEDLDKILGLSAGGDDYVTKPFSPKEVVYRVKSQLRRRDYARAEAMSVKNAPLKFQNLSIDRDACCACRDGKALELTAKEYGILLYLMENPNKIISKERLYEQVWGEENAVCDNTIMVHLRHLREKIETDPSDPKLLITVKGLGYKLKGGRE